MRVPVVRVAPDGTVERGSAEASPLEAGAFRDRDGDAWTWPAEFAWELSFLPMRVRPEP